MIRFVSENNGRYQTILHHTYGDFLSRPSSFSSPFSPTPPQFSPTLPHRSLKSSLPPLTPKLPPEEHQGLKRALGTDTENFKQSKQTNEKVISLVERWEKSSHSWLKGAERVRLSGRSFANLMEKLNYDERAQKSRVQGLLSSDFLYLLIVFRYPQYFYNSLRSEMII